MSGTRDEQVVSQPATSTTVVDMSDKNYWYDRLHPDLQSISRLPAFKLDSWLKIKMFALISKMIPSSCTPPDLTKEKVAGIGVYYCPKNGAYKAHPPAALLWIHGGGRLVGSADGSSDASICQKLCMELNVPVLSASYRLAPKHPFPAALDDLTDAYKWLINRLESSKSDEVKKQTVRIAVAGESAGGGLSAELCQKLLDQSNSSDGVSTPLPVAQLLIYPMLDDRTCVDAKYDSLPPHLVWNKTSNTYGWSSYLGPNHKPGDETLPDYASSSRRKDLSKLPPAYIVCGSLDLFLDECRDYAQRLKDHGVYVEYEEIVGGFHAMLLFGEGKDPVVKLWNNLVSFGKKYLVLVDVTSACD